MNSFARRLYNFFSSRTFYAIVLGFFIFEALWFVFSAVYPMAFDEDFHFGLIKFYSHHLSPFLNSQPTSADQFGPVYRDPSYLYHWLMSFPYRFISLFAHSETVQVIILRLLNVAMFTGALLLFRKVMLRVGASRALAHVTLAIFILIPIVPQLAAHINYDNLFILLMPVFCLSAFSIIESLKQRQFNVLAWMSFIVLAMIMTLIKYAGLPIILAAVLFLFAYLLLSFEGRIAKMWVALKAGFGSAKRPLLAALVAVFVIMSALFVQRYGVNLVRYHNPVPDCGSVLTVQRCQAYSPWARDYAYTHEKSESFNASPIIYMGDWLWGMWHRLFFAVNGPTDGYVNYNPLILPGITAILLSLGLLTIGIWWRKIFKDNPLLTLCIVIAGGYVLVLWLNGFSDFGRTGQPVAINGRYLLPILPLIAVPMGKGIKLALLHYKIERLKPYFAAIAVLLLLHGGGVFTFILRSDSTWYWPNSTVNKVNDAARKVLEPVTIGGKRPQ